MSRVWPDCMNWNLDRSGAALSCKGYGALLKERDDLQARVDLLFKAQVELLTRAEAAEVLLAGLRAQLETGGRLVPFDPTDAMLDAGRELQSLGDETLDRADMRAKYQAMLDAALREP